MAQSDHDAGLSALRRILSADAAVHMFFPLGDLVGPDALTEAAYQPLLAAMPDLERRDLIVVSGKTTEGAVWLGACGHYVGTFQAPWLGIPPTGHFAHMRYHEFYRLEGEKVVEVQAIWDVPELIMQAGVWPMVPSLGREMMVPGPATQDGLVATIRPETGAAELVKDMLEHMQRHPAQGGPDVMEMERFWHTDMSWYGPAGIGTTRGIDGFRSWHQIPFLAAMPERGQHSDGLQAHFFGDGNYAAVTGWPDMRQPLTHGGWLGLPPTGQMLTMRSLDFWRLERGRIRENWVMVDLLDVYDQLGVDVLGRMREVAGMQAS